MLCFECCYQWYVAFLSLVSMVKTGRISWYFCSIYQRCSFEEYLAINWMIHDNIAIVTVLPIEGGDSYWKETRIKNTFFSSLFSSRYLFNMNLPLCTQHPTPTPTATQVWPVASASVWRGPLSHGRQSSDRGHPAWSGEDDISTSARTTSPHMEHFQSNFTTYMDTWFEWQKEIWKEHAALVHRHWHPPSLRTFTSLISRSQRQGSCSPIPARVGCSPTLPRVVWLLSWFG